MMSCAWEGYDIFRGACLALLVAGFNGGLLLDEEALRGGDVIDAYGEAVLANETRTPLGQPPHHGRGRLGREVGRKHLRRDGLCIDT
jgi:hypothetical protein